MSPEHRKVSDDLLRIAPSLQKLPRKEKDRLRDQVEQFMEQRISTASYYSGPIPQGAELEQINLVIPGGAERVLKMAEQQQAHRISIEGLAVKSQSKQSARGQVFAFILCLLLIACGTWMTMADHPIVGGGVFSATIVGVAALFITGRVQQRRELDRKAHANP